MWVHIMEELRGSLVTSMHGHETCMCCRIMKAFHVHVAKRKRSVRVFEGRNNEFLRGTEKRVQ